MGQLEQMKAYQNAHPRLENMAKERAYEMEMRKPNMRRKVPFLNSVPAYIEGVKKGGARSGGEAGLKRVAGKRMAKCEDSDSEEGKEIGGGFLPLIATALPLIGSLFGSGSDEELEKTTMEGGAKYGKIVADEIERLHGKGFLQDFASGIGAILSKVFGGGAMPSGEPAVIQHVKGYSVDRTVPNAIEARAVQGSDYAPEWFRKSGDIAGGKRKSKKGGAMQNMTKEQQEKSVAMAKKGMYGAVRGGGASEKMKKRGQLIKQLIAEKGMKLPEASKYIKEHNLI